MQAHSFPSGRSAVLGHIGTPLGAADCTGCGIPQLGFANNQQSELDQGGGLVVEPQADVSCTLEPESHAWAAVGTPDRRAVQNFVIDFRGETAAAQFLVLNFEHELEITQIIDAKEATGREPPLRTTSLAMELVPGDSEEYRAEIQGHSVDPLTETSSLTELLGLTFKCQTAESFFAPPPHLPPPPPTSPPLSPSPKPPPFSPFTLLLLGASTLSPAKEARATELPALRPPSWPPPHADATWIAQRSAGPVDAEKFAAQPRSAEAFAVSLLSTSERLHQDAQRQDSFTSQLSTASGVLALAIVLSIIVLSILRARRGLGRGMYLIPTILPTSEPAVSDYVNAKPRRRSGVETSCARESSDGVHNVYTGSDRQARRGSTDEQYRAVSIACQRDLGYEPRDACYNDNAIEEEEHCNGDDEVRGGGSRGGGSDGKGLLREVSGFDQCDGNDMATANPARSARRAKKSRAASQPLTGSQLTLQFEEQAPGECRTYGEEV